MIAFDRTYAALSNKDKCLDKSVDEGAWALGSPTSARALGCPCRTFVEGVRLGYVLKEAFFDTQFALSMPVGLRRSLRAPKGSSSYNCQRRFRHLADARGPANHVLHFTCNTRAYEKSQPINGWPMNSMVAGEGVEPPTQGFSVPCSTN